MKSCWGDPEQVVKDCHHFLMLNCSINVDLDVSAYMSGLVPEYLC